jgi:hypothetical protein
MFVVHAEVQRNFSCYIFVSFHANHFSATTAEATNAEE